LDSLLWLGRGLLVRNLPIPGRPCVRYGSIVVSLAMLLLLGGTRLSGAATLDEVRGRGTLRLCANPAALPYSSRSADGLPGFQVELAQAVAREMRLTLTVVWARSAVKTGGCEMTMDQVPFGARYEREGLTGPLMGSAGRPLRFSRPYAAGGVFLIVPSGSLARHFEDVGGRIGVMVDSLEAGILARKGLRISVFAFMDDIIAAVISGEVSAGAVSSPVIGWYRHEHPDAGVAIPDGYEPEPGLRWNLAIGLWQGDDALVDAVNEALDVVVKARTPQRIYVRYRVTYHTSFAPPPDSEH
jgi:polar amino acid transport system substrate-binding protein